MNPPAGATSTPAVLAATAVTPAPPTSGASSAPPAASLKPCMDYVYPIAVDTRALQDNPGVWYQPVTLASIGLNPDADDIAIPFLNIFTPSSPRFRVSDNETGPWFSWTRWDGTSSDGTAFNLTAAMTGTGTLSQGFSEMDPTGFSPEAVPLVNGRLEAGDLLPWQDVQPGDDIGAALDTLIKQKTLLVLPIYRFVYGRGISVGMGLQVDRFVQVRLLGYDLGSSYTDRYFEFALVRDSLDCAD
jgi:hypothetical protein